MYKEKQLIAVPPQQTFKIVPKAPLKWLSVLIPKVTNKVEVAKEIKLNKEINQRSETINQTAGDAEVNAAHFFEKKEQQKPWKNQEYL